MAQRSSGSRVRAAFFLIVSAFAALLAVVLIYRLIQGYQHELEEAQRPPETIKVVVAKKTLYQGQTLGELDIEVREYVPAFVPDTVFHALEEVKGRVPKERILQDEYVRRERLADPDAGVGLNALIPTGQRALSINIDGASSVSGFLNPGNFVDILVTLSSTGTTKIDGKTGQTTVTMMQAQRILAVNNRLGEIDADGPSRDGIQHAPSVTLALTPGDAERLAHAYSSGSVTLTLRNDVDVTQITTNGAHASKILGSDEKQVEFTKVKPKKVEKRVLSENQVLEIYRGTSASSETFKK